MVHSAPQLASNATMRSRVMSLRSVAFQGSSVVGGPIVGRITILLRARVARVGGSLAGFAAACVAATQRRCRRPAEATP